MQLLDSRQYDALLKKLTCQRGVKLSVIRHAETQIVDIGHVAQESHEASRRFWRPISIVLSEEIDFQVPKWRQRCPTGLSFS